MVANRSDAPNGPIHTPCQPQLTFGRNVQNLAITGGAFYSTDDAIRQQHTSGSEEASSVVVENYDLHRGQDQTTRDIHIFDSPQGSMTISGGIHVLNGIGSPRIQNLNEPIGNSETSSVQKTQPALSDAAPPARPPTRAHTTLFSNAQGDIHISDGTILGSRNGVIVRNGPDGTSIVTTAQRGPPRAANYRGADIHIFRGARVLTNVCGRHIISGGSIQVINYLPPQNHARACAVQAAPDSAYPQT